MVWQVIEESLFLKEIKMSITRLFQLMIGIGLVLAVALTVREAVATTVIMSERNAAVECTDLPSRHSIGSEYDSQRGAWVTVSEDGPTGVDGGLVQLFSDYRTCSR